MIPTYQAQSFRCHAV